MAIQTGIATNYSDLLDILVTMLLTLDWVIVEDERATSGKLHIILKGEGAAGDQEIFVGIRKYSDVPNDLYGWRLQGYTGYLNGNSFHEQPGAINHISVTDVQSSPSIPLWNSAIPYWIVANKSRFIVVAKITTVYEACYCGYLLPFGSPGQFPYPLMIGGSSKGNLRYDNTSDAHSHFPMSYGSTQPGSTRIRDNSGIWKVINNSSSNGNYKTSGIYPYSEKFSAYNGFGYQFPVPGTVLKYPIYPVIPFDGDQNNLYRGNIYGVMDGVFNVGGLNNAVENIIQISGDDHLVVQNCFRTTPYDYWALKLV